MKSGTQRNIIIVLLIGILVALIRPDVFRKWTLEVTTEQSDTGRGIDSESGTRPEPQRIHTVPKVVGA